jgi:hypothetical protein
MLLDWIARMKATADAKAAQRGPEEPESPEEVQLQEKLERLLIASFKYMGVTELKQVCAVECCPLNSCWPGQL